MTDAIQQAKRLAAMGGTINIGGIDVVGLVSTLVATLESERVSHQRTVDAYQRASGAEVAWRSNADGWQERAVTAEAEVQRLRTEAGSIPAAHTTEQHIALRYADDPIEAFNLFIQRWVPANWHGHLLDTDENDGQFVRDHITSAIHGATHD